MSKLRVKATEVKQMINSFVQAAERDAIQNELGKRERAQEACADCGGPTKRRQVVIDADGDTAPELICLDAKCGWRA